MADSTLDSILLPAGTLLGGVYRIEGALGKPGGFGITYLAIDTQLEARVAVKEFFPRGLARRAHDGRTVVPITPDDKPGFDHARQRFLDEARMLARFHHPSIVRVRSFFEENGTAYLVMDYLEGRTLAAHLERVGGRVPAETAVAIARPLLDALGEIHEAGVLHRDVDPANVYVTNRQQVVLLDFGAARQAVAEAEGGQRSLSVVLKPGYAPYEQYASKGRQGPWTDLYALAATMYRMLTGLVPQESTGRIVQDELQPVDVVVRERFGETLPPALARAVMWGLALRPEDRPQNVAAFEQALAGGIAPPAPTPFQTPPPITPAYAPTQAYAPPVAAPPAYAPQPSYDPPSYTPQPMYAPTPSYMQEEPRRSLAGPVVGALVVLGLLGGGFYVLTQRPDLIDPSTSATPVQQDAPSPTSTESTSQDPLSTDPGTFTPNPSQPPAQDPALVATTSPRPVEQVRPQYPEQAAAEGLEGRVLVKVLVGTDGTVKNVSVEESTDPVFDAAAVKAVLQWRFEPATRGGEAVEASVVVPFDFNL
ncbi:MAG: TonB family protein [Bacteroidetes bacterium]|nr:TonB family protein [Bacteroidota bacterium]